MVMLQRRGAERVVEQSVDVPVLRFMEKIVEIVAGDFVCDFFEQATARCGRGEVLAKAQAALFF